MRRVLASQTSANRRNGSLVLITSVAKYYRSTTIWQYVKTKLISCPINLINSNLCTFQSDRKCWKITVTSLFAATIITLDYTYYMQLFPTIHGNASLHSVTQHYTQILCTNTISFNKIFHEDFSYAMFIMQSNNVTGWVDGLIEVNDCFPFFMDPVTVWKCILNTKLYHAWTWWWGEVERGTTITFSRKCFLRNVY